MKKVERIEKHIYDKGFYVHLVSDDKTEVVYFAELENIKKGEYYILNGNKLVMAE